MSDLLDLGKIYKAEISRLNAEIKLLRDERLDSARSEEMATRLRLENKDLRSALATAREEGFRAGRLAGIEEAEKAAAEKLELAFLDKMDSAISGPFRIGLNTALDVIRALKEKQP